MPKRVRYGDLFAYVIRVAPKSWGWRECQEWAIFAYDRLNPREETK